MMNVGNVNEQLGSASLSAKLGAGSTVVPPLPPEVAGTSVEEPTVAPVVEEIKEDIPEAPTVDNVESEGDTSATDDTEKVEDASVSEEPKEETEESKKTTKTRSKSTKSATTSKPRGRKAVTTGVTLALASDKDLYAFEDIAGGSLRTFAVKQELIPIDKIAVMADDEVVEHYQSKYIAVKVGEKVLLVPKQ